MPDSGPGSGPGLLRYFKPWQHIDLLDYLAHFYIQVASAIAKEGCPLNYLDRHGKLAFSNSSINTLREILRDNTYFYAREHSKLFVFTWCRIFQWIAHWSYAIAKVFPRITRRACNRESFPPRTICIIRYSFVCGAPLQAMPSEYTHVFWQNCWSNLM